MNNPIKCPKVTWLNVCIGLCLALFGVFVGMMISTTFSQKQDVPSSQSTSDEMVTQQESSSPPISAATSTTSTTSVPASDNVSPSNGYTDDPSLPSPTFGTEREGHFIFATVGQRGKLIVSMIQPEGYTLTQSTSSLYMVNSYRSHGNNYYEIKSPSGHSVSVRVGTPDYFDHTLFSGDITYEPLSRKFYREEFQKLETFTPDIYTVINGSVPIYEMPSDSDAGHGSSHYFMVYGKTGVEIAYAYGPGTMEMERQQSEFIDTVSRMLRSIELYMYLYRG